MSAESRVVIVGTSCSGKTTLARQLAPMLGVPHIELDALHHGPNWTPKPDFADRVRERAAGPAWVSCGNYSSMRDILWPRATAFVWLNYSFPRTFGRALNRSLRRSLSPDDVFPGCQETFRCSFLSTDGIPWWVLTTFRRRRREYAKLFASAAFRDVPLFELRSPAQTDEFLECCRSPA